MTAITDEHEGDIIVDDGDDVDVRGTVAGSCDVRGGKLAVNGTVTGNVTVQGGTVTVTGTIAGDLVVTGGDVHVHGVVVGRLVDDVDGDGQVTVHPGSEIDGTEAPTIGA
jgi:cytoskeletal protein CcmA (bactofilin family)